MQRRTKISSLDHMCAGGWLLPGRSADVTQRFQSVSIEIQFLLFETFRWSSTAIETKIHIAFLALRARRGFIVLFVLVVIVVLLLLLVFVIINDWFNDSIHRLSSWSTEVWKMVSRVFEKVRHLRVSSGFIGRMFGDVRWASIQRDLCILAEKTTNEPINAVNRLHWSRSWATWKCWIIDRPNKSMSINQKDDCSSSLLSVSFSLSMTVLIIFCLVASALSIGWWIFNEIERTSRTSEEEFRPVEQQSLGQTATRQTVLFDWTIRNDRAR